MTNKQEQTSRKAFEEWFKNYHSEFDADWHDQHLFVNSGGYYMHNNTERFWTAWQAATQWADR